MNQVINSNKQLAAEFEATMKSLGGVISSFDERLFNKSPFEGSWTGAQVSEHVSKSLSGINKIVNAQTQPTERKVDQYISGLRIMMEDFSVKTKSASNLLPGDEPLTRRKVLSRLQQNKKDILLSIQELDLSETCVSTEFPGIGHLTRLELISFAAFHMQRHTHQLENIKQILIKTKHHESSEPLSKL